MATSRLIFSYVDTAVIPNVQSLVRVQDDGTIDSNIALAELVGFGGMAFWGGWSNRTQYPSLRVANLPNAPICFTNLLTGVIGFDGNFSMPINNAGAPGIIQAGGNFWALNHFGTEAVGTAFLRAATSLYYKNANGGQTIIGPIGTIGGALYDMVYTICYSDLNGGDIYAYAATQTPNTTISPPQPPPVSPVMGMARFDPVSGALNRINLTATPVINSFIGGPSGGIQQFVGGLSPDGQIPIFFFDKGVPEPPNNFYDDRWMQSVDKNTLAHTNSLTGIGNRSQTPFEAAGGIPAYPWAAGLGMPAGPISITISGTGRYTFASWQIFAGGDFRPYMLWDRETPTTHYGTIADIAGFNAAKYDQLNGGIVNCFDENNNLWIGLRQIGFAKVSLIRLSIAGGLLTQDFELEFPVSALFAGVVANLFLLFPGGQSIQTPDLVHLPDPFSVFEPASP